MKANIKTIRKLRSYSEEFKRSLVREFESGKFSVRQLEKLHGVTNGSIYRWIYKYSNFNEKGFRVVEMKKKQFLKGQRSGKTGQRIRTNGWAKTNND